jgi:poly-gamma-glutamate capsule biosynthesis protein CapA/YwtB (metallophosphatase superfamily)
LGNVTINIGGDFCILPDYLDKELLSSDIKALYKKADINIVNLECPVNVHGDSFKIVKHGPHLQTTEKIFDHLSQLNITAVTLANNHLLDYGEQGVESTLSACKKNNVLFVGAGKNLNEAAKHIVIEKNNIKIAIINFCEHEWSIAGNNAGANPVDIIDNLSAIKKAKQSADIVLLIIHAGNEYYNLPRPGIKKMFRFFADNGADAIISHHTHTVSGYEVYNNVPIIYGLGNMLFTKKSEYGCWYTGLTAQLTVEKNKPVLFNVIPTKQSKENYMLSVVDDSENIDILKELEKLSSVIADDEQLAKEWNNIIEKRTAQYLYHFSPVPAIPGRYVKSVLRKMGLVNKLTPPKYLTGVINYITCESHLELSKEILKKKLYKK